MRRFCFALMTMAVLAIAPAAQAQEAGLTDLYGHGVHAFFSGQTQLALDTLTEAIDAGSQDPRVFYFRGLVWLRMNSPEAAEEDFARGAALETGDGSGLFGVDRALERIQGRTRLKIERQRTAARLAALRQLSEDRTRYSEEIESARPEVTIPPATRPAVPLEEPVQPAAPPQPTPPPQPVPNQPAPPQPPAANQPVPQDPLNAPMQNPPAEAEDPAQPAPAKPAPAQVDPFKEDNPFEEAEKP